RGCPGGLRRRDHTRHSKIISPVTSSYGTALRYDDPWWLKAQQQVAGKPGFPAGTNIKYRATSHVETKYAVWMAETGKKSATVVINNADGVCTGAQKCELAVGYILPVGSKLTAYYPNGKVTL
ncbi:DddA-like double-stranded DNA deaminase toxin, partial [Streptomyces sp. NPDC006186]|uniref:DddA-like double-stranded DNA deaminase toxin n=1 Tax=Streptomyces sp. NPDC006186 TaxID=3155248 RepID=UPI0033B636F3